jgi:DNA-binding winged helix-turn-helix (wHTH) protein/transcriptional regulator with XRE-family HTH domain
MTIEDSYEFGPFRLYPAERLLLRHGRPVRLPHRAFNILLALVKHSGQLVGKGTLMDMVWPERDVEESNVAVNISLVRAALGDKSKTEVYIQTIHKYGYRFVAEVKRNTGANVGNELATSPPQEPFTEHSSIKKLGSEHEVTDANLFSANPSLEDREIIRDILRIENWSTLGLARAIGVSQSAISRWQSGTSTPRSVHRKKLLQLHSRARYRHWGSQRFVPICAFAKSYPADLSVKATEALNEMLNSSPLIDRDRRSSGNMSIDLYIRAAKLPNDVSAYCFADALKSPRVFVVLVAEQLNLSDQRRIAWEVVYAHVVGYRHEEDRSSEGLGSNARGRSLDISPQ